MKILFIVAGVLFLLLALALLAGAAIAFFVARRKRAAQPAAQRPAPSPSPSPQPQAQNAAAATAVPPPPPAPPRSAAFDPEGTVVVDPQKTQRWGALHAISGPVAGRSFPIAEQGFYIGRDANYAHVVVEVASVSKRHVWVGVRDGVVIAIDQASTNGTFLNTPSTRVGEVRLNPGDTLILSDDAARFTYGY